MPTTLFKSGDTGAKTLSGTVGDLVNLLDSVLILNTGFAFISAAYTDRTVAWQQMGAGAAMSAASGDISYFGGQQKFAQLIMQFATAGIGGAFAYEYWNGSAWVALVSPTDGTSGLTADGILSWAIASQTGWATTAVNGATLYWIRVRCTSTPSTNPVLKLGSIYGWGAPFNGTNGRVYRSMVTSGVQHYLNVNDNGPTTGKEARIWAGEAMTQYNVANVGSAGITGPYPTTTQGVTANTGVMIARKSATLDATTRTWIVLADEKTFYVFVLTGDTASTYVPFWFGEFFSLVSGDLYRSAIGGRLVENNAGTGAAAGQVVLTVRCIPSATTFAINATGSTLYVARGYLGSGGSVQSAQMSGMPGAFSTYNTFVPFITAFNGPDGGIFIAPVFLASETTHVRGRLRGIWDWGHAFTAATDGDTFSGNSAMSAKTFLELRKLPLCDAAFTASSSGEGVLVVETSDTWEEN